MFDQLVKNSSTLGKLAAIVMGSAVTGRVLDAGVGNNGATQYTGLHHRGQAPARGIITGWSDGYARNKSGSLERFMRKPLSRRDMRRATAR